MPCPADDAKHRYPELTGLSEGWSFRWLATRPSVLVGVLPLPGGACTLYVTDTDTTAALLNARGRPTRRADGALADVVMRIGALLQNSRHHRDGEAAP